MSRPQHAECLLDELCAPLQRADSVLSTWSFLSAPQVHGARVGSTLGASLGTGLAQSLQGQRCPGPVMGAPGDGDPRSLRGGCRLERERHTCTSTHAHVQTVSVSLGQAVLGSEAPSPAGRALRHGGTPPSLVLTQFPGPGPALAVPARGRGGVCGQSSQGQPAGGWGPQVRMASLLLC